MIAGALLLAAQVVAGIQFQGNTATPDEDMRRLAGVQIGMPFEETTPAVVAERLRKAKHFDRVEVLKRYAGFVDDAEWRDQFDDEVIALARQLFDMERPW